MVSILRRQSVGIRNDCCAESDELPLWATYMYHFGDNTHRHSACERISIPRANY